MARGLAPIPCIGCRYCPPCAGGVSIPRIFELYNDARHSREAYRASWGVSPAQRADRCTECVKCNDLCPPHVDIPPSSKPPTPS